MLKMQLQAYANQLNVLLGNLLDNAIESSGFLPRYSGLKNLKYLASIRGKAKEDEIRKYMELVGLDPDDKKHVGNYSLGMRQRLGADYYCKSFFFKSLQTHLTI